MSLKSVNLEEASGDKKADEKVLMYEQVNIRICKIYITKCSMTILNVSIDRPLAVD